MAEVIHTFTELEVNSNINEVLGLSRELSEIVYRFSKITAELRPMLTRIRQALDVSLLDY
jgi:hypothetical protein